MQASARRGVVAMESHAPGAPACRAD